MTRVTLKDLTEAARRAYEIALACHVPPVVAGGIALAAHGYQRETDDVDVAINAVIGERSGHTVEEVAESFGMMVRARHKFGGLDLRDVDGGPIHIDVLTLDNEAPGLIQDAVAEASRVGRLIDVYGYRFFAVSIGHLICMKLIAGRRKDKADIVELIKARMETWNNDWATARHVVAQRLGTYAVREVKKLEQEARGEL